MCNNPSWHIHEARPIWNGTKEASYIPAGGWDWETNTTLASFSHVSGSLQSYELDKLICKRWVEQQDESAASTEFQ